MHRVTITVDDKLMGEIDAFMAERGYRNRSEAIRDLARAGMGQMHVDSGRGRDCVGAAVYLFDHEKRDLARRLTDTQHQHHDLTLATTHVHLDDSTCLEVALLRGSVDEVRHLADHVMSERGVQHGRLVLVPVRSKPRDASTLAKRGSRRA